VLLIDGECTILVVVKQIWGVADKYWRGGDDDIWIQHIGDGDTGIPVKHNPPKVYKLMVRQQSLNWGRDAPVRRGVSDQNHCKDRYGNPRAEAGTVQSRSSTDSEDFPVADPATSVFTVHGVDAAGRTLLRKTVRREKSMVLMAKLSPCLIRMEA
jgi:hypothetical protein